MLRTDSQTRRAARPQLVVHLARGGSDVRDAQKLRWRVFADELGARLPSPEFGVDRDAFDAHCEHLVVRDAATEEVVGTYRILPGDRAARLGGFYSDAEFDLTRLGVLRDRTIEIGRSCVHPDYRGGATLALLWAGLADFIASGPWEYLIGCASIGMADGGHAAAGLYDRLARDHLSPAEYRVFPRCPLPLDRLHAPTDAPLPPLIKGYLRCGAWVCGAPAWDPDFGTADLLMLMPMARLNERYARHFVRHEQPLAA